MLTVKSMTNEEMNIFFALINEKKNPDHWVNDFGKLDEKTQLKYRESLDPLIIKGYIYLDHELKTDEFPHYYLTTIKLTQAGKKYIEIITKSEE